MDIEGILAGMHLVSSGNQDASGKDQLLASGPALQWALRAQQLLNDDWGLDTDVWSVTSWNELRRDGLGADRFNLLNPDEEPRVPFVEKALRSRTGPVVAVSDYMRAVPDQIQQWITGRYTSLGTNGWGMSDTRPALRRHFLVAAESITVATLAQLAAQGSLPDSIVSASIHKYGLAETVEQSTS